MSANRFSRLLKSNSRNTFTSLNANPSRFSASLPEELPLHPKDFRDHVESDPISFLSDISRPIFDWLEQRLPLCNTNDGLTVSKEHAIVSYQESVDFLTECTQQLHNFFRAVLRAQIRVRAKSRPQSMRHLELAIGRTESSLLRAPIFSPPARPSLLSSRLLSQPTNHVVHKLKADLRNRAWMIAEIFVRTLAEGARLGLVGLVEWTSNDTCRFVYWVAPVVLDEEENADTEDRSPQSRHQHDRFIHRRGLVQTDLMEATHSSRLPSSLAVPSSIRPLLSAIPPMLRPATTFVDGKVVAHKAVEWDFFESTFDSVDNVLLDNNTLKLDPALLIGPFVIAGWAPEDFDSVSLTPFEVAAAAYRSLSFFRRSLRS